jgi:excinuclease ABC subunit C
MTSELLRVPGIGEAKRRQLLEAFGSLQGVRDASPEAIAALPGFGRKTADRIVEALQRSSPTAPAAASTAVAEQEDHDNSESHAASHGADNSSDNT